MDALRLRLFGTTQTIRFLPYPTMLFLGMATGVAVGSYYAAQRGLPVDRTYFAYTVLLIPALLGARVLYVIRYWRHYRQHPQLILARNDGGLALYGGLLLALLCSWPLLTALDIPPARFWDGAAVVILVGMVLTKIGCHLNGCCAGRPTTAWWGVQLRRDGGRFKRTPAQLLESALALTLLVTLLAASTHLPFDGALFWWASLGYAASRFVLEGMRDTFDQKHLMNSNRWISVALAGAAILALVFGGP